MDNATISLATSDATVHSAQGRDYSSFQRPIQPTDLKGLAFAYCRFSNWADYPKMNIDVDAVRNFHEIKAAGLHAGAYWYLQPSIDAQAQADYFFEAMMGAGLADGDQLVNDSELNAANVDQATHLFNSRLDKNAAGEKIAAITEVYTDGDVGQHLVSCTQWPLWMAHPGSVAPDSAFCHPWDTWTFWQWGTVGGVDADAFNGTAADLDAWIKAQVAKLKPTPQGPYRHVSDGTKTFAEIAVARGTTMDHLLEVSKGKMDAKDYARLVQMSKGLFPEGEAFWTSNP